MKNLFIKLVQKTSTKAWLKRTVIGSRKAYAWLPGVEMELNAIGEETTEVIRNGIGGEICYTDFKFKMSEEEIVNHIWSLETRIALIEKGVFVLVAAIRTVDEFDALLRNSCSVNKNTWVKVLRVFTPKASQLAVFLERVDPSIARDVINEVPQAFNDVKAWQLLGMSSAKAVSSFEGDKVQKIWTQLYELARMDPKRWVNQCLSILIGTMRSSVNEEFNNFGRDMLQRFATLGINKGVDMSEHLLYFYNNFPDIYVEMRIHLFRCEDSASQIWVCKELLPVLLRSLGQVSGVCTNSGFEKVKLSCNDECTLLLHLAIKNLKDTAVFNIVVGFLRSLRANIPGAFHKMVADCLVKEANTAAQLEAIWDAGGLLKVTYLAINPLFVSKVLDSKSVSVRLLREIFPFQNWDGDKKYRAFRILIDNNSFPVKGIESLSSNDKAYVYEYMRTRAQIQVIRTCDAERLAQLLAAKNLTEEAEYWFFTSGSNNCKLKIKYISEKKIADSTFILLTRLSTIREDTGLEYLQTYAKYYGLTEEQMAYILQSPIYSSYSHLFEKYLKK